MKNYTDNNSIFNEIPKEILYLTVIIFVVECFFFMTGEQVRYSAVRFFGYWPSILMEGDNSLYFGQNLIMFFSYAFLHIDFSHMILNSAVLLALGRNIAVKNGEFNAIVIFLFSVAAGASLYAVFGFSSSPAIGASGGVFGYIGFWKGREFFFRRRTGLNVFPVIQFCFILVLIDLFLNFILGGILAWEVHLGGFLSGWLFAIIKSLKSRF